LHTFSVSTLIKIWRQSTRQFKNQSSCSFSLGYLTSSKFTYNNSEIIVCMYIYNIYQHFSYNYGWCYNLLWIMRSQHWCLTIVINDITFTSWLVDWGHVVLKRKGLGISTLTSHNNNFVSWSVSNLQRDRKAIIHQQEKCVDFFLSFFCSFSFLSSFFIIAKL